MRFSTILVLFASWNAVAQNPAVTLNVDAALDRKPISPKIYGVAYGTTAALSDLNAPLNRYGGNNTTRYNWQQNADNRGNDWYFESIGDASAIAGERGDTFISTTRAGGAEPMMTIPMIDWVAKLGSNRTKLSSFSQSKYGLQTGNDGQWFADAGNGILKSTNQNVTGNDQNDANVPKLGCDAGWLGAASGRAVGDRVGGRLAVLHHGQRAFALAFDAPGCASCGGEDGRDPG